MQKVFAFNLVRDVDDVVEMQGSYDSELQLWTGTDLISAQGTLTSRRTTIFTGTVQQTRTQVGPITDPDVLPDTDTEGDLESDTD